MKRVTCIETQLTKKKKGSIVIGKRRIENLPSLYSRAHDGSTVSLNKFCCRNGDNKPLLLNEIWCYMDIGVHALNQ